MALPEAAGSRTKVGRLEAEGLEPIVVISEGLAREFLNKVSERIPLLEWSIKVPEPKTGTLNFERFPFQPAIYRAMGDAGNREVVVRKATQVGVSAMTIRWAIFEADRNGRTVLYVFPTLGDVHDFSDARVGPMIDQADFLIPRKGEPYNKGLKKIGPGLVYFRGSENKRGLDSVDADCLALDEYDTLNQAHIPDAERRLSGVMSAGLIRRVGVPSLPEFGIAEKYDESDRQKWLVQCESCTVNGEDRETRAALLLPEGEDGTGGWQEIDFWLNVDQESESIVCAWCREPLDVGKGEWASQNPSSSIPGFHVSRLIVPGLRLSTVIKASKATAPAAIEVFYNKDLGLPYASKEARLSADDIKAAQSAGEGILGPNWGLVNAYAGENLVTMGIDVASERAFNVRISEHLDENMKRALWIGEVEDPSELVALAHRYRVWSAAIDAAPEGRLSRAFEQALPGRAWIVRLVARQKEPWTVDDEQRYSQVVRTFAMDAVVEQFRRLNNLLPMEIPDGYVSHMTANVRRVRELPDQRREAMWESTRPDDYAMAELFDLLATELYYRSLLLDDATRSVLTPLDDLMPFERSTVADLEDVEYRPGRVA